MSLSRYPTFLMLAAASISLCAHGQRSQEMFLPMLVEVTANNARADQFGVVLYKDNDMVVELPPGPDGAFQLELDLNANYTVVINKPGFRRKSVAIDTQLPDGVKKYKAYLCQIDLEAQEKFTHSDQFYLDFPSALVRWDPATKGFDHSDTYLADIQLKIALLGAQAETH